MLISPQIVNESNEVKTQLSLPIFPKAHITYYGHVFHPRQRWDAKPVLKQRLLRRNGI